MSQDSFVLTYLSKASAKILSEVAVKQENGEFLPDITNPYFYKKKQELLNNYLDLVIKVGDIFKKYEFCKKTARIELRKWIKSLKSSRSLENKLYFDSHFIDIGGDH